MTDLIATDTPARRANGSPVQAFDPAGDSSLWEIRTEERPYALLSDSETRDCNRYGQKIDLLELTGFQAPAERPLYINENPAVGSNPNRNKQHGFYFTADNCIGCHACEAACAEKNETPPHLAFRSVGYVEGGSYPDYQRLNISMACNHCDDPVCLKGCPTAAYSKHAEYGAVLQDPDTCFGCGYCTWVCPYNAPQLDPIQGQVSKCNMCVDRLEVGLKPACVSACVGNALDFGVIENVPENREEARTTIPGFPDPGITHPNIRFQQSKRLPEVMTRTDSNPVRYRKAQDGYHPAVDEKSGRERHWNLTALSSRENVLVAFTLLAQAGIGAFTLALTATAAGWIDFSPLPLTATSCALVAVALFMSTVHLGKPHRFYRGFNNLRYSPVSREGLGVALFLGFAGSSLLLAVPGDPLIHALLPGLPAPAPALSAWLGAAASACAWLAALAGLAGLYYMVRCYRIPARPFWNHWQVGSAFTGTALTFGGLLLLGAAAVVCAGNVGLPLAGFCGAAITAGLALEGIGLAAHARDLKARGGEGAAAHYVQSTRFGCTYLLRNVVLGASAAAAGAWTWLTLAGASGPWLVLGWLALAAVVVITALVGRALFYVLVIPTTMPGAFFWRNPAFTDHARATGLARMPQVGVYPD